MCASDAHVVGTGTGRPRSSLAIGLGDSLNSIFSKSICLKILGGRRLTDMQ